MTADPGRSEFDDFRRHIERIERRLELAET